MVLEAVEQRGLGQVDISPRWTTSGAKFAYHPIDFAVDPLGTPDDDQLSRNVPENSKISSKGNTSVEQHSTQFLKLSRYAIHLIPN
jgi:hypothetical protein